MPFVFALLLTAGFNPTIIPSAEIATSTKQEIWQAALAECESGGRTDIKVMDVNNKYSHGKYQYQMGTWLAYAHKGATKENIFDEQAQDAITLHILRTKGDRDWINCSKKVRAVLGAFPK